MNLNEFMCSYEAEKAQNANNSFGWRFWRNKCRRMSITNI